MNWGIFKKISAWGDDTVDKVDVKDPIANTIKIHKEKLEIKRLEKKEYKNLYNAIWRARNKAYKQADKDYLKSLKELRRKKNKE